MDDILELFNELEDDDQLVRFYFWHRGTHLKSQKKFGVQEVNEKLNMVCYETFSWLNLDDAELDEDEEEMLMITTKRIKKNLKRILKNNPKRRGMIMGKEQKVQPKSSEEKNKKKQEKAAKQTQAKSDDLRYPNADKIYD